MKSTHIILLALAAFGLPAYSIAAEKPVEVQPTDKARDHLLQTCQDVNHAFTPKVRAAFLDFARKGALAQLKLKGKSLPADFMAWVDRDPDMATGVYAAHNKPEDVLLWLYSLRLDLGKAKFEQYRHLALAAALVSTKEGVEADITPRKPLKLAIGRDPRKPVNTKDSKRKLDVNDHIINFLNDHTIEDEVRVGKIEPPELKYDDRGIAIPVPENKKSRDGAPATQKVTR